MFSLEFWLAAEALLSVAAGVCLAIPAIRMTRALMQIQEIDKDPMPDQEAIADLASRWSESAKALLGRWDRLDHFLIYVGFATFVASSLIKLGVVWLA